MAKIGWNKYNADELQSLLTKLTSELKTAVFHTITDSTFDSFLLNGKEINTIPLEKIARARAFGLNCEVRWIFREGKFHTTVLCEQDLIFESIKILLQKNEDDILELEKYDEHSVILWGERDIKANNANKFWFEGRIPQKLHYSADNKGSRVQLTICEYCEQKNWKSRFYRFKEVSNVE